MSTTRRDWWLAYVITAMAAAAVATLVECAFFWPNGLEAPPGGVLALTLVLALSLIAVGWPAALRNDAAIADVWFLVAVATGLVHFGGRRLFLALGILAAVGVAVRWRRPPAGYPPVAAVLAGSIIGNRLHWFFTFPYDGRATEPVAIVTIATYLLLAVALLRVSGRWTGALGRIPIVTAFGATALALGVGLAWFAGDQPPRTLEAVHSGPGGPPIVVIVLDTVRADHLELYGYSRDTMPLLAAFAEQQGVVVDRALTPVPNSLPGHVSMFTGMYPDTHGAHGPIPEDDAPPLFAYPLRADVPTAAEILGARGYATAGVASNFGPVGAGLGVERGFQYFRAVPDGRCEFEHRSAWWSAGVWLAERTSPSLATTFKCDRRYRRADSITDEALQLADAAAETPMFLFVNYMDAHAPYDPPRGYAEQFAPEEWRRTSVPHRVTTPGGGPSLTGHERSTLGYLYDGSLAYLDMELDRLLRGLQQRDDWQEMLVVIVADHGESLGEHGVLGHVHTLYDEMVRVPLVIRGPQPELIPGTRWSGPIPTIDIFALAMRHAGVPTAAAVDAVYPSERTGPVHTWSFPLPDSEQTYPELNRELRAVELAGWKLLESYDGDLELYDLTSDPLELRNLAGEMPERTAELRALLGPRDYYRLEHRDQVDVDGDALARLRALGYVQ